MSGSWWTYLFDRSHAFAKNIDEGLCRSEANRHSICAIDIRENLQEDDSATNLEETCELGAEDAIAGQGGAK